MPRKSHSFCFRFDRFIVVYRICAHSHAKNKYIANNVIRFLRQNPLIFNLIKADKLNKKAYLRKFANPIKKNTEYFKN